MIQKTASQATALPFTLLMLLHLHLLDFKLKDGTTYDAKLFDPKSNGIRERTRAMEDISFLLVARIEGGRERAKKILPTYPCVQPSESTAFRISLVKYLDVLRYDMIGTSNNTSASKATASSVKGTPTNMILPALWWKDVLVRKSLLEECSGERFEKLVLALSTQALYKLVSHPSNDSEQADPQAFSLDKLPKNYDALLASARSQRTIWERNALFLLQRQAELHSMRKRLMAGDRTVSPRYDSLSTEKLIALCESARADLLRSEWKGERGQEGLDFVLDLAGLQTPSSAITVHGVLASPSEEGATSESQVQPLPTAAAHHPAHLATLKASVFPSATESASAGAVEDDKNRGEAIAPAIQVRLDAAEQVAQSLRRILAETDVLRKRLEDRLQGAARPAIPDDPVVGLDLRSWSTTSRKLNFNDSSAARDALAGLSLPRLSERSSLEERIAHIRGSILPPYPPLPSSFQLFSDPEPPTKQSHFPNPASSAHSTKQATRQAQGLSSAPRLAPSKTISSQEARAGAPTLIKASRRTSAARARRSLQARRTSMDDEIDKIIEAVREGASFEMEEKTAVRGEALRARRGRP